MGHQSGPKQQEISSGDPIRSNSVQNGPLSKAIRMTRVVERLLLRETVGTSCVAPG